MKKLILTTLVVASTFASSSSYAWCTKSGYIERVTNVPGAGASLIYLRPSSLFNAYFLATTADAKIVGAANTALIARTWVSIQAGTTTSVCPANNGNMGGIANLIVAP